MNSTQSVSKSITVFAVTHQGQRKFVGQMRGIEPTRFFGLYPLVDAINDHHHSNIRLIAPDLIDHALAEEDHSRLHMFPFVVHEYHPVNAVVAYEKAGAPLSRELVFREGELTAVFHVPSDFVGEKDVGLVAPNLTTRDFAKIGDETLLVVPRERIIVVRNFPTETGWYRQRDPRTAMPFGERVRGVPEDAHSCCGVRLDDSESAGEHNPEAEIYDIPGARMIVRHAGPYVGGLLRIGGMAHNYDDGISLAAALSETFDAFPLEIPEADLGKFDIGYVQLALKFDINVHKFWELLKAAAASFHQHIDSTRNISGDDLDALIKAHQEERAEIKVLREVFHFDIYYMWKGSGYDLASLGSFTIREPDESWETTQAEILSHFGNPERAKAKIQEAAQAFDQLARELDGKIEVGALDPLRRYIGLLKTAKIEPIL